MQKWIKENLDYCIRILIQVREGIGLNEIACSNQKLTSNFIKLHKQGYISGIYFIGYKYESKYGARITDKGLKLIKDLEDMIENDRTIN